MGRFISVDQIAARLGLTTKATRIKIARGQLPFRRLGKLIRVDEGELEKFIATLPGRSAEEAVTKVEKIVR